MSTLFSFLGMLSASSSYFMKKRWQYLIAQGASILLISLSNLLLALYYAFIASGVSLSRIVVYYFLEKKNKEPTFTIKTFFAGLVVFSYIITNLIILRDFNPWDIMLMAINVSFVYIVGIRNITIMRYCMLPPTLLAILYCIIVQTAIFTTFSFVIELISNIVAIIVHKTPAKRKKEIVDAQEKTV